RRERNQGWCCLARQERKRVCHLGRDRFGRRSGPGLAPALARARAARARPPAGAAFVEIRLRSCLPPDERGRRITGGQLPPQMQSCLRTAIVEPLPYWR